MSKPVSFIQSFEDKVKQILNSLEISYDESNPVTIFIAANDLLLCPENIGCKEYVDIINYINVFSSDYSEDPTVLHHRRMADKICAYMNGFLTYEDQIKYKPKLEAFMWENPVFNIPLPEPEPTPPNQFITKELALRALKENSIAEVVNLYRIPEISEFVAFNDHAALISNLFSGSLPLYPVGFKGELPSVYIICVPEDLLGEIDKLSADVGYKINIID